MQISLHAMFCQIQVLYLNVMHTCTKLIHLKRSFVYAYFLQFYYNVTMLVRKCGNECCNKNGTEDVGKKHNVLYVLEWTF